MLEADVTVIEKVINATINEETRVVTAVVTKEETNLTAKVAGPLGGDMHSDVYDPNDVAGDVFDTDNHVSGEVNKVFTAEEQTKLGNQSGVNTGDYHPPVTKTADYVTTTNDHTILIDGSSESVTITARTAVGIAGREFKMKCIDDTYDCFLDGTDSQTIDGSLTQAIYLDEEMTLQSDGVNWRLV